MLDVEEILHKVVDKGVQITPAIAVHQRCETEYLPGHNMDLLYIIIYI